MQVGTLELSVDTTNCEQAGELIGRIRKSLDDANDGFKELATLIRINASVDGKPVESTQLVP